jgi:alkane 1-monooxygenase
MKDFKYLIAYIIPVAAFWGIYFGGLHSYSAFLIGFAFIPLLELFLKPTTENHELDHEETRSKSNFFDFLIYLNLPLYFSILIFFFYSISTRSYSSFEWIGLTLSIGTCVGTIGINVAHELGHRQNRYEQVMALSLLMTALYMQFYIEHNKGHHKNVATDEDPSSARQNETIYAFWIRSVSQTWMGAWRIEMKELAAKNKPFLSIENKMIRYTLIQMLYLSSIYVFFGTMALIFAVLVAIVGILLLESVNYIEHYGLKRKKMESGHYEPVREIHSWNSDHQLGRIFLFELTRHSDHHYKSTRKYQILRHFDNSPQLPYGYPGSIVLSLFSPLWFKIMNKELLKHQ